MQSLKSLVAIEDIDDSFVVKWRLTDACNYRCSYCIRREFVTDMSFCKKETVFEVNRLLRKVQGKTKVDLIGGEVTVLPFLPYLLEHLEADKINITTNTFQPATYFLSLPHKEKITLTCSYHPEFCKESIENFFYKVAEFSDDFQYVKVETVATENATHLERFKELANAYKLDFQIEEDLQNPRMKGASCSSQKKNPRYRVTFADGSTELFGTRNEFLKKYGVNGIAVSTRGMECNRGVKYVYIEKDDVWTCTEKIPVAQYNLGEWHPCSRKFCTLCGHISLRSTE